MAVQLDFDKQGGLVTAVVQDAKSGRVLMVGYMNLEAFEKTVSTGHVTFFSRSRGKLWTKGETSGHFLQMRSISTDCDGDALLVQAEPVGPGVCHNGFESCFYRTLKDGEWVRTEEPVYDAGAVYGGAGKRSSPLADARGSKPSHDREGVVPSSFSSRSTDGAKS